MSPVAGDQVVRVCGAGAFQKPIVVRAPRFYGVTILDEMEELLALALANLQLRASQHIAVFAPDRLADVEPGRVPVPPRQPVGSFVAPIIAHPMG